MSVTRTALIAAGVFDGEVLHHGKAVLVDGKHITGLCGADDIPEGYHHADLGRGVLAPGFIDVQVNGGGGYLLNETPNLDGVCGIAAAHRRFGTVGLMPTVITDAPRIIAEAIAAVESAATVAPQVLGIHVEGPFLDPVRKGAHEARFIRILEAADIAQLTAATCKVMITLAPNRVSPAQIAALVQGGVIVSLGHSDASYDEAAAALAAGARGFTHLYNAMSQMAGREPAMVGAALAQRETFVGIIPDGFHVHDEALQVAYAAKGAGRIMLITDAMTSAAGGPDHFALQGRVVSRRDGRLTLDDGTLAGSDLSMDQAVRYCVQKLNWPLTDVLRMASRTPAEFLLAGERLGRIQPGFLASLVHLDDDLMVRRTWIEGQ